MDPRTVGPQQRAASLSDLMKAKARASAGEVINACPFGCSEEELDGNGYCRHLVGFTTDGVTMEPLVSDKHGKRVVQVQSTLKNGKEKFHPEPIPPGSRLVRITVSSRVYHEGEKTKKAG